MSAKSNNVYKPKMAAFLIATIMLVLVVVVILMATVLILSTGAKEANTTTTPAVSTPWIPQQTTPAATTTTKAPDVTTTPATTTTKKPDVPDVPVVPGASNVVLEKSQSGLGSLVLVDNHHFYTKEGLVGHKTMDAATASRLGFGALAGNTGNFKLKQINLYLDLTARDAFNKMMADLAAAAGSGDVQVRNAYYYNPAITEITSQDSLETVEHSTGLVVDLEINQEGRLYPLNHPTLKAKFYDWLMENAWKYGFIHVRDIENKYSTFRYIGIPHAAALHKDVQLTHQTYLTVLTAYNFDNRMKVTDANGAEWWIYYVKAESDAVTIPVLGDESVYQISGDNNGGFVVAIDSSKFAK